MKITTQSILNTYLYGGKIQQQKMLPYCVAKCSAWFSKKQKDRNQWKIAFGDLCRLLYITIYYILSSNKGIFV